jgi:argininosuccinate lyase
MRAWGGCFRAPPDPLAAAFGQSVDVDHVLALADLQGSAAHVLTLEAAGLVTGDEAAALTAGLDALADEVRAGSFVWDAELEDVHLNLEMALADRIGPVAAKLHTGRSRNDQVATDLRLWLRAAIDGCDADIAALEDALVTLAERHRDAVLPGTTHVQPAQPVLFAHHLLSVVEALERDRGRFRDCRARMNVSPLGSGAIAGAGFALDRDLAARTLGFAGLTGNSIDATGDRDFVVEYLAAAALTFVHLSRFAEELVWWSNPRFGYVRLSEPFSTGSSMLPNKRNPDPAELIRGRAAGAVGHLTAVLTLLKGLPNGYQRDLQEDKRPVFETAAALRAALRVLASVVSSLEIDEERMAAAARDGHLTAVSVADTLVDHGVAFRAAHHITGALVAAAEEEGSGLEAMSDATVADALRGSSDELARALAADAQSLAAVLRSAASGHAALARCDVIGGTAPARVHAAVASARARLDAERSPGANV